VQIKELLYSTLKELK